jgi:hypothetical protein
MTNDQLGGLFRLSAKALYARFGEDRAARTAPRGFSEPFPGRFGETCYVSATNPTRSIFGIR